MSDIHPCDSDQLHDLLVDHAAIYDNKSLGARAACGHLDRIRGEIIVLIADEAARLERERVRRILGDEREKWNDVISDVSDDEAIERASARRREVDSIDRLVCALGPLSTHLAERDDEQFHDGLEAAGHIVWEHARGIRTHTELSRNHFSQCRDEIDALKRPPAERDRENEG